MRRLNEIILTNTASGDLAYNKHSLKVIPTVITIVTIVIVHFLRPVSFSQIDLLPVSCWSPSLLEPCFGSAVSLRQVSFLLFKLSIFFILSLNMAKYT